ncbi:hypothetical protein SODALDRAFT_308454 [Sodiomyces alkalinus F11]|uniref:Endoplasmic reticulum junction formation protein lunapark n=1 Tax=Sodiomyces alkalinus (strain CBS 110278 / VKM F-3762 / F11) TaxID=1314773 RepID=A0A3N2Q4B1_SODAK|nr:hypothetical protein SODALDRAFT_308454 [Sodiomyces alkalinus F11]ROT41599.1 hypothetical protein SODALDRAFT_308454 [Sodiomyces alkalinus F11]
MVSFWPWRRDDSSPASFEKTLSALSAKITDLQSWLERTRASSRRARVLSMLYLSVGYLVLAIVQLLVVGYQNMGPWDWAGVAGGPVVIYIIRTSITGYFNFRIESLSAQLKQHHDERAKTIQKLKDATKYNSTLELLEKYGGSEGKLGKGEKKPVSGNEGQEDGAEQAGQGRKPKGGVPGRTTMPPPPTANIRRPDGPTPGPGTPQPGHDPRFAPPSPGSSWVASLEPSAEFAPNAYAQPPPPQHYAPQSGLGDNGPHWYDRILDLLLGEDETAPRNRIVLICQNCRLVNGQAPPGTKSLAEMGTWKCMGCGAANGEVDEGKRLIKEVLRGAREAPDDGVPVEQKFKAEDEDVEDDEDTGEAMELGESQGQSTGKHNNSGARKRRSKKG